MYRIIVEGIDDLISLDWLIKEIRKKAPNIVIRYEKIDTKKEEK